MVYDDLKEIWNKCLRSKLLLHHRTTLVIFRDQKLMLAPEGVP